MEAIQNPSALEQQMIQNAKQASRKVNKGVKWWTSFQNKLDQHLKFPSFVNVRAAQLISLHNE